MSQPSTQATSELFQMKQSVIDLAVEIRQYHLRAESPPTELVERAESRLLEIHLLAQRLEGQRESVSSVSSVWTGAAGGWRVLAPTPTRQTHTM
ncbi:uncharacterized protein EHS24_003978 [Apiotrichum porosum]|uniref:Uncharacterized protein n=1 Tax=Apiotrichum porosum TaxID=105984 RepID=A0A427Y3Z0_9TREE|nr:uncharacterized protein EHS24_003978 [Apiotrichum porosum]RSH85798.1 hypothetical protein EHS24_003978 [Apiotrichum porosum]